MHVEWWYIIPDDYLELFAVTQFLYCNISNIAVAWNCCFLCKKIHLVLEHYFGHVSSTLFFFSFVLILFFSVLLPHWKRVLLFIFTCIVTTLLSGKNNSDSLWLNLDYMLSFFSYSLHFVSKSICYIIFDNKLILFSFISIWN